MDDSYNLQRFVIAQQPVYANVLAELRAGLKQSHWMWFIFPQIRGLGHSPLAQKFAISTLDEAEAYLQHAVLGMRLRECSRLVADINGRTIQQIFGYPDDMKFHSSMTLFSLATQENDVFKQCLNKYFSGEMDAGTLAQLGC
ncbi:MAG: calpastatin [Burkholderiales bacterium RIFCSPLOWO2_02_FULL_57_36]|nr:MAG: calpastatin [Burkholderiales bacterium RIFCSPLOWO2_02_FULL_57_36]